MYRGTWLLVGLPFLVAAFSVGRAEPLPAPTVPPTFDGAAAATLAEEQGSVALLARCRADGSLPRQGT
jgi:hypothetical protein